MLRRTEKVALPSQQPEIGAESVAPPPAAAERGAGPVGSMQAEIEREFSTAGSPLRKRTSDGPWTPAPQPPPEEPIHISPSGGYTPKDSAGRAARRGMDALRDEALRNVIAQVEDRHFGGIKDKLSLSRRSFSPRVLLLGVALVTGGIAAYLALQLNLPAPAPAPVVDPAPVAAPVVVAAPTRKILALTADIPAGTPLTAENLGWIDWPEANLRPEFLDETTHPDAVTAFVGRVPLTALFAGDPVRPQTLGDGSASKLSALLSPGMRGVSVMVAAETASGGFIKPGDRVDVVLTRTTATGPVSRAILTQVRVIALNADLAPGARSKAQPAEPELGSKPKDEKESETFGASAIATLELSDVQADIIMTALQTGKLSLVLRASADITPPSADEAERARNDAIRMTSPFWTR